MASREILEELESENLAQEKKKAYARTKEIRNRRKYIAN